MQIGTGSRLQSFAGAPQVLLYSKRASGELAQHYLNCSEGNIHWTFYKEEKPVSDFTRGAATQAPRPHVKNIESFKLEIFYWNTLSEIYLAHHAVTSTQPFGRQNWS